MFSRPSSPTSQPTARVTTRSSAAKTVAVAINTLFSRQTEDETLVAAPPKAVRAVDQRAAAHVALPERGVGNLGITREMPLTSPVRLAPPPARISLPELEQREKTPDWVPRDKTPAEDREYWQSKLPKLSQVHWDDLHGFHIEEPWAIDTIPRLIEYADRQIEDIQTQIRQYCAHGMISAALTVEADLRFIGGRHALYEANRGGATSLGELRTCWTESYDRSFARQSQVLAHGRSELKEDIRRLVRSLQQIQSWKHTLVGLDAEFAAIAASPATYSGLSFIDENDSDPALSTRLGKRGPKSVPVSQDTPSGESESKKSKHQ
ncbi:hypothetical protein EDD11_009523 [Mortierella claussenii]|nr:hypothetical protein EDD11_009523 [Mortierella claussenii]